MERQATNIRFVPRQGSDFTLEQVDTIATLYRQYGQKLRLVLDLPLTLVVPKDKAAEAILKLEESDLLVIPSGNCVKDIKVCVECSHGTFGHEVLGRELNQQLMGESGFPSSVHISVSGCGCLCAMGRLMDIGLAAGPNGYTIYVGGSPYGLPIIGQKVASSVPAHQVASAVKAILEVFRTRQAGIKYLHQLVKRDGLEVFQQAIAQCIASQ